MVAPVAVAAGKKAADNPAASVFMLVLVGAVLVQGIKNLPDLGSLLFGKLPGADTVKSLYEGGKESVLETWETQYRIVESFEEITPEIDPIEKMIFGEFSGSLGPEDEEQFGFWQTGYRGARLGLFTGMASPWAPY